MSPQPVKLIEACPKCGCEYAYLMLDLSDEEAEDLPIVSRCARCKKELARTTEAS